MSNWAKNKFLEKIRSFPDWRILIIAFIFTIFLFAVDFFFFPQTDVLVTAQSVVKGRSLISLTVYFGLTLLALLINVYAFYVAFTSSFVWKFVWFILFSLAILTQYGFYYSLNRFIQIEDYELIFTIRQMFTLFAVKSHFNYFYLPFCFVFAVILVLLKPYLITGWKQNVFISGLFCIFFGITSYSTLNLYPTTAFVAFYRTAVSFPVNWFAGSKYQSPRRELYNSVRENIAFNSPSKPLNNIVLIVDESVRADHLSLNGYARDTTPYLIELEKKGVLRNWKTAVSGGTCSVISNNLLLSGLTELPDPTYQNYKMPSIFQYAKAMGYKNYHFDGIYPKLWFGKNTDLDFFDERITEQEWKVENLYETDERIAKKVSEIIRSSTGNFIWVNKLGVHIPYQKNYPQTAQIWQPISEDLPNDSEISDDYRNGVRNNYDNALKFNLNLFFSNLIKDEMPANTYIIYTSDHGQTLSENGERFSHCGATRNEANVPLFILASENLLNSVDTNFPAAHRNIFATLLDMMNFPESERKYSYAISLFKAKGENSAPRTYFVGDTTGKYFSKSIIFDK